FPDNREGRITITAHLYADNFIELSFSDNGIGFPVDIDLNEPESLGLKIIRSLVEKQIKGNLLIQTDDETRFVIKFKEKENRQRI
ncbi:MAG: sensor histidine kinase, partial [Nitrospirae bacterium]|nr:sensor histidine kinase [Nitrospirota bacterium]